ncbi:MAG: hypothetical protein BV456_09410, partial [Thermoplasmata archaeon M8B2D]
MQNKTQEEKWLKDRLKIVGASEISTVIKSECTEDDIRKAMSDSADEFLNDKLFVSPFALYHYKKELAEPEPFSPVLSEFGHEMEKYAVIDFNRKNYEIISKNHERINAVAENKPQELIYCKELHKLCAYTPDAFIEFGNSKTLHKDVIKNDKAIFEIKTSNLFKFHQDNWGIPEEQKEVKFQYIIQAQYQLWIQNKIDPKFKWAVIACILPKEKEIDNDFWKGKAVAWCQDLTDKNFKKLQENFAVYYWIYPIFKTLHPLFEKALNKWGERLENNIEPKPNIENNTDIKIQKEKLLNNMEDFKIMCQKKFGKENQGIIEFTEALKQKYEDIYDKLCIDKQNREDKLSADKAIKEFEAKMINFCVQEKCLGFNIDDSTIHIKKWGKYLRIMNNFKTNMEKLE